MDDNITATGLMIRCMAMANLNGLMVKVIEDITKRIRNMGRGE